LFLVGCLELIKTDMPKRRKFGSGADRAHDKSRMVRRGIFLGKFFGKTRGLFIELHHAVLQSVLGEHNTVRAERVGLDHIAANFKETFVDAPDGVRLGDNEVFITAILAAKILRSEIERLEIRPQRPVEHKDLLIKFFKKWMAHPVRSPFI